MDPHNPEPWLDVDPCARVERMDMIHQNIYVISANSPIDMGIPGGGGSHGGAPPGELFVVVNGIQVQVNGVDVIE